MQVDGKVSFTAGFIIYYLIRKLNQTIHWCGNCQDPLLTFCKGYTYFTY